MSRDLSLRVPWPSVGHAPAYVVSPEGERSGGPVVTPGKPARKSPTHNIGLFALYGGEIDQISSPAMDRRNIASIAAAVGCVTLIVSAHIGWFDGRAAFEIPVMALLQADVPMENAISYWSSVATPLEAAALIGLIGAWFGSRAAIAFGSTVCALTLLMWHLLRIVPGIAGNTSAGESGVGVTLALSGLLVLVAATAAIGSPRAEIQQPLSVFDDEPHR